MFRQWFDWLGRRRHLIQYEIQRMTHKGGWQNYYQTSYESPPSRPTSDDEIQILGDEEGRFRCIRRKDSQIDTVVWEYETVSAEEIYATRRREAAQRDQLAEMGRGEIREELECRSELTELAWRELFEAYFERCENTESDQTELKSIESQLVQTVADRNGPRAVLNEYRKLMSEKGDSIFLGIVLSSVENLSN